jgi:ankyrin repeat protein
MTEAGTSLPEQPDLELLRKRAKELLRAARRGETDAVTALRSAVPRLSRLGDASLASAARLADAQHAIARQHGLASWPMLLRAIEEAQPLVVQCERLLAAIRARKMRVAVAILARHPKAGVATPWTAAATGQPSVLTQLIDYRADFATMPHPGDDWPPILYAAASLLHRRDVTTAAGIRQCVELLLARGADANTFTLADGADPSSRIPALYHACMADHAALVELLLVHGADPNDGESIYHAAEHDHRASLEVLLRHGADPGSRHRHWKNTPLYFLAGYKEFHPQCPIATRGMAWLLEHGADPNVASYATEETPLHRFAAYGRGPEAAELLLRHGAKIDQPRADGRTAYALAVRTGNVRMAEFLRERGADTAVSDLDRFLGACIAGDATAAGELLARSPELVAGLAGEDRQTLALAAEEGNVAAVQLMVGLGFDLSWEGAWEGTPLHHAAWFGRPDMVRLLLELGAPLDVRDRQYGSSPIAWAAHGSRHCRRADDAYCAIVEMLLDAGSAREPAINKWNEPPESMASRRVAALLRRRGFAPPV